MPRGASTRPAKKRVCKDCKNPRRNAKYQGPRCWTCNKEFKGVRSAARKAKHVETNFGITEEEYQAIYEAQGGYCYLCRRARGTGKYRLAVDHDHELAKQHDHPEEQGCWLCVRGLLCRSCNRNVFGHLRDEIAAFERGKEYLLNPPARAVLAKMRGL